MMEANENDNSKSNKKNIPISSLKNNKFKNLTAEQIIKKYEDVLFSREKQFYELSNEIGKLTQKIQFLVQKKEKSKYNNTILKDIYSKDDELLKQELSNKEIAFMKLTDLEHKYDDLQNKIDDVINKQNALADSTQREKEKMIQDKEIYENAYLNLIFCLIRSEYYAEALETIEEFKENNNEISQYKSILDNYAIEVYLRLGDFEKALNLAKENLSNENQDEKGSFLSNSNNQVYNEITYRLALYINLIKINILNNNFKEAQKYIVSVLSLLNYPTEKELPPYVINIIVFYFLSIGKNEEAVQIIKFRRIPKFYNN